VIKRKDVNINLSPMMTEMPVLMTHVIPLVDPFTRLLIAMMETNVLMSSAITNLDVNTLFTVAMTIMLVLQTLVTLKMVASMKT